MSDREKSCHKIIEDGDVGDDFNYLNKLDSEGCEIRCEFK